RPRRGRDITGERQAKDGIDADIMNWSLLFAIPRRWALVCGIERRGPRLGAGEPAPRGEHVARYRNFPGIFKLDEQPLSAMPPARRWKGHRAVRKGRSRFEWFESQIAAGPQQKEMRTCAILREKSTPAARGECQPWSWQT